MKEIKQFHSLVYSAVMSLFISLFPLHAVAELLPSFSRDSFGSIVLKDKQNFDPNTELELSIGNYQNEYISTYSEGSVFSKMGKSVGRLDTVTDVRTFPCTAFVVSERYILTNYHCSTGLIKNSLTKATRIDAMKFVAGYLQTGVTTGVRTYHVIPTPVEVNASLDYAVHEVIGDPSADFGVLKLSATRPNDGDPFWIIGHPLGEAQRISREQCKASSPAIDDNRVLHTCDTLPGNSGSPVIDASSRTVVALHHAGSRQDEVNFAILMSEILKASEVLQASLSFDTDDVQSDAQSADQLSQCDILYDAASKANQCFAYQAYANSCSDHMLAPIAAEYMKTYCEAPAAVDTATTGTTNTADDTLSSEEQTAYLELEEEFTSYSSSIEVRIEKVVRFSKMYPNSDKMPRVQYLLGLAFNNKGDFKNAARVLLNAFNKYPDAIEAPEIMAALGFNLIKLDEEEVGCNLLGKVEESYPGSSEVSNSRNLMKNFCE